MFSRFFINRPVFAAVLSIVVVLAGAITLFNLPVSQYPDIQPPTVTVQASYPGASARVVAESVGAPIEQQVNGVAGMIYMSSSSTSDGNYALTITFETGTDLDMAAVLVQNRVAVASSQLPEEVTRGGVTTRKRSPNFAMCLNLVSDNDAFDSVYLSNYATLRLRDELSRIPGVGEVTVMGADEYSMRIWLDPGKLKERGLTTSDVVAAIREQNVQVAAGVIGQPPAPPGQVFQYTVTVAGRLQDAEQFGDIIIRSGEGGRFIRVRDVARVELGTLSYAVSSLFNGKPTALLMIYQSPGANVLELSQRIRRAMAGLKAGFPQGLDYVVTYDASLVVQESIQEIAETLLIATLLVVLTVFIFLQDWRATIIPAVTIPVSLIGTFTVMSLLGFSINTLTLFGLVLAIGIVVDDAIVVVENVARNLEENDLSPKEATIKAMGEVSGPVVATTLVLLAVFIPTAFMGGITGILYRQFGLTIATATVFSSINALTLSPALSALLLRGRRGKPNRFFAGFNRALGRGTEAYLGAVDWSLRRRVVSLLIFGALAAAVYFAIVTTPTSFVPNEDQGLLLVNVQLPDAASLQRTKAVMNRVNRIIAETPGVAQNISITGFSILNGTASSNMGSNLIVLKPWGQRQTPQTQINAVNQHLLGKFSQIQEANIFSFSMPPLPGLGVAGGFQMMLQDRSGLGLDALEQVSRQLLAAGYREPGVTGLYASFRAHVPQLTAEVDRAMAKAMDVPVSSVFSTMQAYLGSTYVNDFNKFGRTYRVMVQADAKFRARPEDILALQVRNNQGGMVPLGAMVSVHQTTGAPTITRYNMYPAASIMGKAAPGYSSGQALKIMARLARQTIPQGMGFEWTGISWQEAAGGAGALIFLLAVVFVYLVLAAQYESWKTPAPVVLSVPLAMLGAFVFLLARGMDNSVYTQIGLVLLVGLASKNAILIVEFAKSHLEAGLSAGQAAMQAARLRFRPILMTSLAFILGVIPLVVADGAGAGARRALGTAVFGGMLAATILGVVLVPLLFEVVHLIDRKKDRRR